MGATSSSGGAAAVKKPGFGWNPLTDIQVASSGVGDWLNHATGGGNWGLGSALTFAPNALAGIGNILVKAEQGYQKGVTTNNWHDLAQEGKDVAQGLGKGILDTEADIVTLGGIGVPWRDSFLEGMRRDAKHIGIDYKPEGLLQKYRDPNSQGVAGGALNDLLNVTVGAGVAAKFAKAGEIGGAAEGARAAEMGAKAAETLKADKTLADIGAAGKAARAEKIASHAADIAEATGQDAGEVAQKITQRAKFLDRVETMHNAVDTALNPWRLFRGSVGEMGRAATNRGLADAPEAQAAAEGVSEGLGEEAAKPRFVAGKKGIEDTEPPGRKMTEPTPREQAAYNRRSQEVPAWATKVVDKIPEVGVRFLQAVDDHLMKREVNRTIRENERYVATKQAELMRDPAIARAVEEARGLLDAQALEHNTVIDASTAIGERLRAALRDLPAWRKLEGEREGWEGRGGSVEEALGFKERLPAEINTPEFRARIEHIASEIGRLYKGSVDLMLQSRGGRKGLEDIDSWVPKLSAKGKKAERIASKSFRRIVETKEKMEAAAEKERERTGREADAEFAAAREQRRAAASARIAARAGDAGPFETPEARLEWANKLSEMADARVVRAKAQVAALDKRLSELAEPYERVMEELRRRGGRAAERANRERFDPTYANTPPVFQPMIRTMNRIAEQLREHPELEELAHDVPKRFGEAVAWAMEEGWSPTHVPELTPRQVRTLISRVSKLGGPAQMERGGEFLSGARKARRGVIARLGAEDSRIEGLVAGILRATHEDRTNHVVDMIERVIARPAPKGADGKFYEPPNYVAWSSHKNMLLNIEDTARGTKRLLGTDEHPPLLIPKAVARELRSYTESFDNPFSRAMAKITNPWRALVLTMSPHFYMAHMLGHMQLALVSGGTSPKDWAKAWTASRKDEFGNRFGTLPQVVQQSIMETIGGEPSMVHYSSARQAYKGEGFGAWRHEVAQKAHNIVSTTDAFARAVTYFSQMRKMEGSGLSREAMDMRAMNYASEALVDYDDLSNFEKRAVKSVMPFYGFQKGILKIAMRLPLDHPLTASIFLHLARLNKEWQTDSQGNELPESMLNTVDAFGGKIDLHSLNPFKDVVNLTTPEGLVSSLQFAIQGVVRAGLHDPLPGHNDGVTVDHYGRTVPNVPLLPAIASGLTNSPQGRLLTNQALKGPKEAAQGFFGLRTYSKAEIDKAGQQNLLSRAQAALPKEDQKKAALAGEAVSKATALKALGGQATGQPLAAGRGVDAAKLNAALASYTVQQAEKKAAAIQSNPRKKSSRSGRRLRRSGGSGGLHFRRGKGARRISRGRARSHIRRHHL